MKESTEKDFFQQAIEELALKNIGIYRPTLFQEYAIGNHVEGLKQAH